MAKPPWPVGERSVHHAPHKTARNPLRAVKRGLRQTPHAGAMKKLVTRFLSDESAATAIEYGLIAALIAVVIISAVQLVGTKLKTTFASISGNLK